MLLRPLARPGSPVLILSDLMDLPGAAERQLKRLARHHGLLGVMFYDPLEAELPRSGMYSFSDGKDLIGLSTSDGALRKAFRRRFSVRQEKAAALFQQNGGRFIALGTQESWVERLRDRLRISL
jgi:uncharacterized protein (DUF58 family)